jgi:hypothetical protein
MFVPLRVCLWCTLAAYIKASSNFSPYATIF